MNDHDQWVLDHDTSDPAADDEYWQTEGREMSDYGDPGGYAWYDERRSAPSDVRTRNVLDLRLKDLAPPPGTRRLHRRREPIVIAGEEISETLRERLNRETRELEIAVTQLANQLARRTTQLEHLKRFPENDPFDNGVILHFEKSFPASPDVKYSYAAHKVADYWFLTGERSPQHITWDQLVDWMGLGVDTVYQVGVTVRGGRKKVIG